MCPRMQHFAPITWGCDGTIRQIEARSSGTTIWAVIPCRLQTMYHIKRAVGCYRSPLTTIRPNDSALLRQSQCTFTSRALVLQVRRSGGRDIPRVRCWQQRGSFIHTIGGHYISRSARKNSSSGEWWCAPSAALERGTETELQAGRWRGGVKDVHERMRNHCYWAGPDGISLLQPLLPRWSSLQNTRSRGRSWI